MWDCNASDRTERGDGSVCHGIRKNYGEQNAMGRDDGWEVQNPNDRILEGAVG